MEEMLYAGKGFLSFLVPHDWLMEWENIGQENVTVLSHMDHFLTAASWLFEMLYDMAERGEEFDSEFIWNVARQGICMTFSAGMSLQDLVKNSVSLVGETMTTR